MISTEVYNHDFRPAYLQDATILGAEPPRTVPVSEMCV